MSESVQSVDSWDLRDESAVLGSERSQVGTLTYLLLLKWVPQSAVFFNTLPRHAFRAFRAGSAQSSRARLAT